MNTHPFIQRTDDNDYLLIDGCVLVYAELVDEESGVKKCAICHLTPLYHETFDAYFCAYCNRWNEKRCGDADCRYCVNRPDTPLPSAEERVQLKKRKQMIIYPPKEETGV